MTYDSFYSSVLPGNYALTKSMELTKVTTSGTLWYTKKFLVLYYYVFLSSDLMTREYIRKVTESFDSFIATLDPTVQAAAEAFFYPENDAINFKSAAFKSFTNFAAVTEFNNQTERDAYYQNAKKMYFTLLMGSGGQTGVKKKLKEAVESATFVYSEISIKSAIMNAVEEICVEQINDTGELSDNSVKYIISNAAIEEITALAASEILTKDSVREIISRHADHRLRYRNIENDMVAFIRNERQILYYYGYFHSKSAGATDEFSSLTPVGEIALNANSQEFLAIWEHQKIKMISQPATADINNVISCCNNPSNFAISYTPYTDILGHILRNGSLTVDQYKYIVSRRSHCVSENDWISNEADILAHLDDIKRLINGFGRTRDKQDEDARKELLKYLLGVRSDLPIDATTHSYGVINYQRNCSATNNSQLEKLYRIYFGLETYKVSRYHSLFEDCENDLRRRYNAAIANNDTAMDPRVKINWDLYNIRVDKFILFGVAVAETAFSSNTELFEGSTRDIVETLLPKLNERYGALLRIIGYRGDTAKRAQIRKIITALRNNDYSEFVEAAPEDHAQVISNYREVDAADLRARIEEISSRASELEDGERVRNTTLVSLLKSYYMARFLENDLLKCECCGEETFITSAGEPYVEFHHLIPFNIANGPDHYLNLFALCPNCHRKIHFLRIEEKHQAYSGLSDNNYLHISFVERLRTLKEQMILRSYHLEYLLAENAITEEEYESIAA